MLAKRISLFFIMSLIASGVSILIVLGIGKIPIPLDGIEYQHTVDEYLENNKDLIFSQEEVEESARIARIEIEKKISAAKERERDMGFQELLDPVKQRAVYVTWLPWLFIPFFVSFKRKAWTLSLLLLPLLLTFAGIFSVIEILLFGVGLVMGVWVSNFLGIQPRWRA